MTTRHRCSVLRTSAGTREFDDVSLTVHSGEIVGIAGLVGSGPIRGAGDDLRRPERVQRHGRDGREAPPCTASAPRYAPVWALAPEERKSQALLLDEPIWRNVTLAALRHYATAGFSNADAEIRGRAGGHPEPRVAPR